MRHPRLKAVPTIIALNIACFLYYIFVLGIGGVLFTDPADYIGFGGITTSAYPDSRELLVYMFLHAGILHLTLNMAAVIFTSKIETDLGTVKYLGLYLLCGMLGGLGAWWFVMPDVSVIGASGAACGLIGYRLAFQRMTFFKSLFSSDMALMTNWNIFILIAAVLSGRTFPAGAAHLIGYCVGFFLIKCKREINTSLN